VPQTFLTYDARSGAPLPEEHVEADAAAVDAAVTAAGAAAGPLAGLTLTGRAALLEAIADAIAEDGEQLVVRADTETALGEERLTGELARTVAQFRAFAGVVREGAHLGVVIDHADVHATPPRPDLRRTMVPIGAVAVFGAGNFPLAFGVAGGDTASALAAGCPVVAKSHPSCAGTSALISTAVAGAVAGCALPPGAFTLLQGAGEQVGVGLVAHPGISAVGFTGSVRGGRALADLAAARPEPVPFYAEMGSHNAVWITPAALAARGERIAQLLAESATLGAGQLCTRPSVVFLPDDDAILADAFVTRLAERMTAAPLGPMLDERIRSAYTERRRALAELSGVEDVTPPSTSTIADGAGSAVVEGAVLLTDLATWRREPLLHEECFGPLVVVMHCAASELIATVATVPGGLTASIWSEPDDADDRALALALVSDATTRVGRVLHDGVPTGVTVAWAQQHGGPYPATTASRTTSVGMHAVDRFLRPVTYQDLPEALLPVWLRDANPWSLPRRVDGVLELPAS